MITYLLHPLYIIQQTLCLYEYPWLPNQSHLFPEMLHLCQIMEKSMFSMGCHVKLVMYIGVKEIKSIKKRIQRKISFNFSNPYRNDLLPKLKSF